MFLKYFFTTVLSAFLVLSINSGLVYSNDNLNEEIAEDYFLKKPLITQSGISYLSLRKMTQGGHLLPNWVETNNFSIEWGNNISNFDGGTDSYRIVSCSKGPPCSGIPDMVDKWVDYFEEVWEKEIGDLGYIRPSGTDTYLYDIYIIKISICSGWPDITEVSYLLFPHLFKIVYPFINHIGYSRTRGAFRA